MMSWLLILIGLALLVTGGELLIRGAVALAKRLGMSTALIGITLVGFGTSMPEFVATFGAAAKGSPDIAFGNVIGSNTANILMILGICTLIHPITTRLHGLGRDAAFVGFSSLACWLWIALGGLPLWGALALITAFAAYMFLTIRADIADEIPVSDMSIPTKTTAPLQSIAFAVIGIAALIIGADLLIRGASDIARGLGVSEALIGITIVGIGTSLPEATASIISSLKKENALAFANIVGSNIFNGLGILGLTAIFHPLNFTSGNTAGFSIWDGAVLFAATAAMFVFALTHKRILRWEGALLLLAYLAYLIWLISRAL